VAACIISQIKAADNMSAVACPAVGRRCRSMPACQGTGPGSQTVRQHIAEARVAARYDSELQQFNNERYEEPQHQDPGRAEAHEPETQAQRHEEENVVQHVDAAILAADEAPEWRGCRRGAPLGKRNEGGPGDEQQADQSCEPTDSMDPMSQRVTPLTS
jgi:hypothetical protein